MKPTIDPLKRSKAEDKERCTPFLKWVGGKRRFIREIRSLLPGSFNDYYEPFLGSGAAFCAFGSSSKAFLSDTNEELINAFLQVRDNCERLIQRLSILRNSEDDYYRIRAEIPAGRLERAARFIYLNKAGYNGIYRVNRKGVFNVPYGHNPNAPVYDAHELRSLSRVMRKSVELRSMDFEESLSRVRKGDLVFLDPPYTVSHSNNSFIEYNKKLFSWEDQERLSSIARKLSSRGAYFILTNAAHPSILNLYGDIGTCFELRRQNGITSVVNKRGRTTEYVFTNCR